MKRNFIIALFFSLIILLLVFLTGCSESDSLKEEKTNNKQFNVELLFEKDNHKIYRFSDGGKSIYYVVPEGQVTENHTKYCGKNCYTTDTTQSITTNSVPLSPEPSPVVQKRVEKLK